jgi:hypothetical protein
MMVHMCTPPSHLHTPTCDNNLKIYLTFLFNYGDSANFDTGV